MRLNFSIDTEDLYGEDGLDFENLLSDSLRRSIIADAKNKVASEEFKKFSQLVSDSIVADIKLRMENFLSEEIALTEGWGKPTFVGSIEDLIKKRFDDVLLRPVNDAGQTMQGCTSSSQTWIEWAIKSKLNEKYERTIKNAANQLEKRIIQKIDNKLNAIKDSALKEQVDAAFNSILKKAQ